MKIRIVVPLISDVFNVEVIKEASQFKAPDTVIDVVNLDRGTASIESHYDEILAAPVIVSKVVKFHSRILARNIPKQYKVADLSSSGIPVVQEQFRNELEPLLRRNGVILEDLVLRKITFEEE